MTSIKIFTYVVGTMACFLGLTLCLIFLFPYQAEELGVTDGGIRSHSIIFIMWMGLFAVSMHVYAQESRRRR